MKAYTESERHAIDAAYGKIGRDEPLTSDEMQIVMAFEREQATDAALASLQAEQIRAEGEQRMKDSAEAAAIARETLELKRKKAQADYAASVAALEAAKRTVEDGQE